MSRLSTDLGISRPVASDLIDRLEAAGWVQRTADAADRRRVLVSLTDHAVQVGEG